MSRSGHDGHVDPLAPGGKNPRLRTGRVGIVESLRGLAALAVAWFHFTNGSNLWHEGWIFQSGRFGWLGVQAFFVLSGFVIPLSLARAKYSPGRQYGRFLARRLARLEPPYLASLVLVLLLSWLSTRVPGYEGKPFTFDGPRFLLHLGYLNTFVGQPWMNPVYWTLAIEFQFYLFMGLWIAVLRGSASPWREVGLFLPCVLGLVLPQEAFVFRWLPLFAMGVVAFQYRQGWRGRASLGMGLLLASGLCAAFIGFLEAGVGLATALCLVLPTPRLLETRPLLLLGSISYSLYLLHIPIGGRVMGLFKRWPASPLRDAGALLSALGLTLLTSYVFWRLVEVPAQRWSRRIPYGRPDPE